MVLIDLYKGLKVWYNVDKVNKFLNWELLLITLARGKQAMKHLKCGLGRRQVKINNAELQRLRSIAGVSYPAAESSTSNLNT